MDPFLGEIRLMAIPFAPRGWASCQGQLMSISQNTALFSLLGVTYGGDGRSTFGLPDLRSRTYVGAGQGPGGLTAYPLGTMMGGESETLRITEMPVHTHTLAPTTMPVSSNLAGQATPTNGYYAVGASLEYGLDPSPSVHMAADVLTGTSAPVGTNQPHENRMPLLAMEFCIAVQGIFPQRP